MTNLQDILRQPRGLRSAIAKEAGITPGAVYQWGEVPPEHVLVVERVAGIPRHKLRPDLYPEDATQ